jgi:hypothetical protein
MLFRVGKLEAGLTGRAAIFAEQSRNVYDKFDLPFSHRQHFKCSGCLAVADQMAGLTDRTDDLVGMDRAVEDRFAVKKSLRMCSTE